MTKLSALIVAHNEEAILDECLKRLAFADEIVVVLDRCSDGTKDIALKHGATLIEGGWEIEGDRRMMGIDACTGPWILEVDADEWIEPPLAEEISLAVAADAADFYFTPIHNITFMGAGYDMVGWPRLRQILRGSLFRKGYKTWAMDRVHPGVSFQGGRGPDFTNGVAGNLGG